MTAGEPATYDLPPEPIFECDVCAMLQYLIDKVELIDLRLESLEGDYNGFVDQNAYYQEWNFQPDLAFVPPSPPPTTGSGLGLAAIFGLITTVANLILLTHRDLKESDQCLAMPEHWQLKPEGHRPQLVVQCAEVKEDGTLGSAKYVVTIPHYQYNPDSPGKPFDRMYKGKYYGVLRLNDNSKIQVYCDSESEARRVLTMIGYCIDPQQTYQTYIRTGEISNPNFKNVLVYPKYATYYSKGTAPDSEVHRIYWG